MPGPESQDERRDVRLHNGLFWGGVGLAPLAALLLLMGQEGGSLRIAAVLAILAVVLIGLSITLRSSSDTVRLELEEVLYEEVDALRNDVREDVSTAARATHKAFGEKLQGVYEQVTALRAQLDAMRVEAGRSGYDETSVAAASVPPRASPAAQPATARAPVADPRSTGANGWAAPGGARANVAGGARAHVPGVVRHTETVQVTTRQTIVDPAGDDAARDAGRDYGASAYSRLGESDGGGWADQRQRGGESRTPAIGWSPSESRAHDHAGPAGDERWSGVRAGDQWGSLRDDDRGREIRVGERRAALHSDQSGTEVRIEDRWASVRREETRREESRRDEPRRDEPRRDDAWREPRRVDAWRGDAWGEEPRREEPRREESWREEPRREENRRDEPRRTDWWAEDRGGWRDEPQTGRNGGRDGWRDETQTGWRDETQTGRRDETQTGWRDETQTGWGSAGRGSGRDQPRTDAGWGQQGRAAPALPAGGVQPGKLWDNDWVEPEAQPIGGRRRRDDDTGFRYLPEPEDRWR